MKMIIVTVIGWDRSLSRVDEARNKERMIWVPVISGEFGAYFEAKVRCTTELLRRQIGFGMQCLGMRKSMGRVLILVGCFNFCPPVSP